MATSANDRHRKKLNIKLKSTLDNVKKKFRDGCGNAKCGREYCRSSQNFKYKHIDVPPEGNKDKKYKPYSQTLLFIVKQILAKEQSECTDEPFFNLTWNSEKTENIVNQLDEIALMFKCPVFFDDLFLTKSPITDKDPSIDFDSLAAFYKHIEAEEEVLDVFQGALDVSSLRGGISTLQQARQLLILCLHPSIISYDLDSFENQKLVLYCFRNINKNIKQAVVRWMSSFSVEKLLEIVQILQQFLTIEFAQLREDFFDYDPRNVNRQTILRANEEFHDHFIKNAWGTIEYLDCIYEANKIYRGEGYDFWRKQQPPISYEEFYNDEVNTNMTSVNLLIDWKYFEKRLEALLQRDWILDAGSKAKVLEHYAKSAMNQQAVRSIYQFQSPYLKLQVRRNTLIQDTLSQLQMLGSAGFRKPLRVKFTGEEGIDEGGVKKEFFQILIRELFDANYGMFTYNKDTDLFWFNAQTLEDAQNFELIGMILGLAIYNNIILDIRFPNLVFKKILGVKLTFEDFRDFDAVAAKGLEQLLRFDGDIENTFMRSFTYEYDYFGSMQVVELKPGGAKINVTKENRKEFVRLYTQHIMENSVEKQFKMLNEGFQVVAGEFVEQKFSWEELKLLVVGSDKIDFMALQDSSRYMDGYKKDSQTVQDFWEICHNFAEENQRKLLSFCTGSDRIPIRGLSDLILTISKNGDDPKMLPTSHTCYNHLLLPEYNSKNILRERLETAIQNSEGFGLL